MARVGIGLRSSFAVLVAASTLLAACAERRPVLRGSEILRRARPDAPVRPTSTLTLRTAIVAASKTTLSCHGGAFCREDVVASERRDAIAEITDDCARRRGTTSSSPCPRAGVVASCGASGESGSITVFTYAQIDRSEQAEAVSTMTDLCEAMGGELALTSAAAP